MADAQVLYVVTAVVTLGLVAWVVMVLSRPVQEAVPRQRLRADDATKSPSSPPASMRPAAPTSSGAKRAPASAAPSPSAPITTAEAPTSSKSKETSGPVPLARASDTVGTRTPRDDRAPAKMVVTSEVLVEVEEEDEPTGPTALILVTAVGRTDPGLKRKHNEDAYAILEDHHLFVIADGMGRHAAGEVASQLCVDAITEAFRTQAPGGPSQQPSRASRLRTAILQANARIMAAAQANDPYSGMGTTVVAAFFSPSKQRVYIAHVGDSRCYRLRGGKLLQLTMDHTLGAAGIPGKSAAVLSRAVGIEENVEVDVTMESPLPGDIYLLCSDGLSRMVGNDEIQATLEHTKDLEEATRVLVDRANQQGGRDNITIIVVRVDDAKPPSAR